MIMPGERISSIFYRNIWSLSNSGNISAEYQQPRNSGGMTDTQHPATELPDTGDSGGSTADQWPYREMVAIAGQETPDLIYCHAQGLMSLYNVKNSLFKSIRCISIVRRQFSSDCQTDLLSSPCSLMLLKKTIILHLWIAYLAWELVPKFLCSNCPFAIMACPLPIS